MKKGLYLNQRRKDLNEFVQKQQKVLSDYTNVKNENPHTLDQMVYEIDNEATTMGVETNNSISKWNGEETITNNN